MAESTSLLRMRRGNSTEGSNPSRSATYYFSPDEVSSSGLNCFSSRNFVTTTPPAAKNLQTALAVPSEREDAAWMQRALELAAKAEAQGDVPVGCVVVNAQGLVAEGFNAREYALDPTAHAELLAIRAAAHALNRWRLADCTLYVTLEPCFMCAGAIVLARMPRVVFATTDTKAGASGSLANVLQDARLNHRCAVTSGILQPQASAQLKSFFAARRAKKED